MWYENALALFVTFATALIWLRVNDFAAHRGWIDSHLSRKLIHIGTGPLFVLCWLLFTGSPAARFLAALVPLLITLQFILVGFSIIKDDAAVQAMSRTGNPREILRGPTYYGLVFVAITLLYWRTSPIGITALMLMCGGDGLAEIVGRRWGKTPLPWNRRKTWIGSMGMLLGGWSLAILIIGIYVRAGIFGTTLLPYLFPISAIAVLGTIVETLPFRDIDNLTVTAAALIAGHLLFP